MGSRTGNAELRRHRLFETSFPIDALIAGCAHGLRNRTVGVYGNQGNYTRAVQARVVRVYGGGGVDRRRLSPQAYPTAVRAFAMGIDWMTGAELSQAIPPAYTEWIGTALLASMRAAA